MFSSHTSEEPRKTVRSLRRRNAIAQSVFLAGASAMFAGVTPTLAQDAASLLLDDSMQPIVADTAASGRTPASDESTAARPAPKSIVEQLSALTPAQRANAEIEIEPLRSPTDSMRSAGAEAAALWNSGQFDKALKALTALEAEGSLGMGIAWRVPPMVEGGIAGFGDITIDAGDATGSMALDIHKASGNLYCVVQNATGYSVFRSNTGGITWSNPYNWAGPSGVEDVDAAIVGNLLYIGYVASDASGDLSDLRVRRAAATTGAIDGAYSFFVAFDASPATIEEVAAASNVEGSNTNIFFATLQSDDSVGYHWDTGTDGTTWIEIDTGFNNGESGLDITLNDAGSAIILSYISNTSTVEVAVRSGVWTGHTVEPAYDGAMNRTAISAWLDTIIVGYRDDGANGMGLRYRVSYDDGDSWAVGTIYAPGVGGDGVLNFDVCARGGFGLGAVYVLEVGPVDQVWFRKRDGYQNAGWDAPVQINDDDVLTSTIREPDLNWVASIDGSSNNYRFGIVYPQPDPTFDRRQQCDGDVNESGAVDVDDLVAVILGWGACADCQPTCNADIAPFSGNCNVDVDDLVEVILGWGTCP